MNEPFWEGWAEFVSKAFSWVACMLTLILHHQYNNIFIYWVYKMVSVLIKTAQHIEGSKDFFLVLFEKPGDFCSFCLLSKMNGQIPWNAIFKTKKTEHLLSFVDIAKLVEFQPSHMYVLIFIFLVNFACVCLSNSNKYRWNFGWIYLLWILTYSSVSSNISS